MRQPAARALAVLVLLAAGATPAGGETICPAEGSAAFLKRMLTTRVEIDAPAQVAWDVLLDFERYGEWNPFVTEISGAATPGGRLAVTVRPPGRGATRFEPVVLAADTPRELRWRGSVGVARIFDGEHSFVLEPLGAECVRLVHAECFRGILVPLLWRSLDTDTRAGFEQMNAALRARAETIARARTE